MQLTIELSDEDVAGWEHVRIKNNALLPQTIEVDGERVPNPELKATVADYARFLLQNAGTSYRAELAADTHANPSPAPAPAPSVIQSVTMRQAQLALLGAGLLDDVEAAIQGMPETTPAEVAQKKAAKITWDKSSEVKRDNWLIAAMAGPLHLTPQMVDNLFAVAATL
jgi:hypothetical protein